jgi:O-acetyl-ADP-ribose deacetylase
LEDAPSLLARHEAASEIGTQARARLTIDGTIVECVEGNIADQPDIEAVVNAANAELRTGAGVAGALHRAAGPGLERECRPLAPIGCGEAVITGGHDLPNRYVIHCLGPVYGVDEPSDRLLASCYCNALQLAEQRGITSIAFPAISTGVFGYPLESAASTAIDAVVSKIAKLSSVKLVRFVLFDDRAADIYAAALSVRGGRLEQS